jgi:hypothetical protein
LYGFHAALFELIHAFLHFCMLHVGYDIFYGARCHNRIQIIRGVTDAVVRKTVLREIVCAYFFFAATGADKGAALG